jgi:hypothetical protein
MMTSLQRNQFIAERYDELMRIGKHGHYETMFQVVAELLKKLEKERHGGLGYGGIE